MRKGAVRAISGATAITSGLIAGMAAIAAAQAVTSVTIACGDVAGLKTAISNANAGTGPSTIILASNCTYTLTTADNNSGGQGANGLPIVRRSVDLVGSNTTIERSAVAPNFRILEVAGTGGTSASLTIQGITISGGHASGSTSMTTAGLGGCLLATFTGLTTTASFLTLQNAAVQDCTAVVGGGIYAGADATLAVGGSAVRDNTATGVTASGGGIAVNSAASATIALSSLKDNTAVLGTGGGLSNAGDTTLKSAVVSGNHASLAGGGIFTSGDLFVGATFLVQNSTLLSGGAIFATSSADTRIAAGRFQLNTAAVAGGAIGNKGDAFMQNSFITQNTAPLGGAIFEGPSASFAVFNSLIFGNALNNCRPLGSVPFCVN